MLEAPGHLPLGLVGDLDAARRVARAMLLLSPEVRGDARDSLATLVLTAVCLHAAHVAQDDVGAKEVAEALHRLRSPAGMAELAASPSAFICYSAAELGGLNVSDALRLLERLIGAVEANCSKLHRVDDKSVRSHLTRNPA